MSNMRNLVIFLLIVVRRPKGAGWGSMRVWVNYFYLFRVRKGGVNRTVEVQRMVNLQENVF